MKKTAIVLGATGLVGSELTAMLLKDTRFDKVKLFVRRDPGITHEKAEIHIVDFKHPENWKKLITGDILYSALGTTLKDAGSKEAQYLVDYTYQYNVARYAANQHVPAYILVSAAGSSVDSPIFYSKMKGELERDIKKLPFERIHLLRPGMLYGKRNVKRAGEKIGATLLGLLAYIPGLHNLKPIPAHDVAQSMVNLSFGQADGIHVHGMAQLFRLAKRHDIIKEKR